MLFKTIPGLITQALAVYPLTGADFAMSPGASDMQSNQYGNYYITMRFQDQAGLVQTRKFYVPEEVAYQWLTILKLQL